MLTLRYFGPFEVRREGDAVGFPTRPCARLFALLATEPGHRWRREAVAREIWPEAEWATETVSLRTALTMLRRTLGNGVIGSDRERVWVEPGALTTDGDRFGALLRREGLETDGDRREAALAELAESPPAFLDEWEAPWIVPLRTAHARAVARVALDLSRLRLASGRYEEARTLALRSLVARPGNDHAIAVAVRAAVALGDRDEALELAARAGASAELRRLVDEIDSTHPTPASPVSGQVPGLLFDAFESNLQEDPESAVRFLVANLAFWRRQREVARAKELLTRALDVPLSNETRAKALATLGMLHTRSSHYQDAFAAYAAAESLPIADERLVSQIAVRRAFLLYETRRYEESRALFDRLVATLPDHPADPLPSIALNNRAGLRWQLLDLEGGKADYRRAIERYDESGRDHAYLRMMAAANLACIAHVEEDWPEAEHQAALARELVAIRFDPAASPAVDALFFLARAAQGDGAVAGRLVRTPLEVVRSGMRRISLIVFDYVAEGLAFSGAGQAAKELAHVVGELRDELGHARSPAEDRVYQRTLERSRQHPGANVPPAPSGDYAALAVWTVARGDEI